MPDEHDRPDNFMPDDIADTDNDRAADASNSDAAADTARETERIAEAGRASRPSHTLENDEPDAITDDRDDEENVAGDDADRRIQRDDVRENELDDVEPISDEDRDALTGSTNLPLDDLQEEGDPAGDVDPEDEADETR